MADDPLIIIALVGGPHDGEEYAISPVCSVGLPQRLEYAGSDGKQAVWHAYEFPFYPGPGGGATWSLSPERMVFNYAGKRPMLWTEETIKRLAACEDGLPPAPPL